LTGGHDDLCPFQRSICRNAWPFSSIVAARIRRTPFPGSSAEEAGGRLVRPSRGRFGRALPNRRRSTDGGCSCEGKRPQPQPVRDQRRRGPTSSLLSPMSDRRFSPSSSFSGLPQLTSCPGDDSSIAINEATRVAGVVPDAVSRPSKERWSGCGRRP